MVASAEQSAEQPHFHRGRRFFRLLWHVHIAQVIRGNIGQLDRGGDFFAY